MLLCCMDKRMGKKSTREPRKRTGREAQPCQCQWQPGLPADVGLLGSWTDRHAAVERRLAGGVCLHAVPEVLDVLGCWQTVHGAHVRKAGEGADQRAEAPRRVVDVGPHQEWQ